MPFFFLFFCHCYKKSNKQCTTTNQCLYPLVTVVLNEFSMPFFCAYADENSKNNLTDQHCSSKKLFTVKNKQRNKKKSAYSVRFTFVSIEKLYSTCKMGFRGEAEIKCWKVTIRLRVIGDFHMAAFVPSVSLSFVCEIKKSEWKSWQILWAKTQFLRPTGVLLDYLSRFQHTLSLSHFIFVPQVSTNQNRYLNIFIVSDYIYI